MCIFKPLYDEGWSASPGNLRLQEINCVNNAAVAELMRGLRSQLSELIVGLAGSDIVPMSLGLSHSLSRYKLKFSPDKVNCNPCLLWAQICL
jgi:RNA processing factor Prp31